MNKITPILPRYYNSKKLNLADVITPPYDVIGKSDRAKFLARSPYNFAHIILPNAEDPHYEKASSKISEWTSSGIFLESSKKHFYLYSQQFEHEQKQYRRDTLMCSVQLCDFSEGKVLPHEQTHGKVLEDRLKILENTQCNLSPIFAVVKDADGILASQYESWMYHQPLLQAKTDDGISHALWEVPEENSSGWLDFLQSNPLYIVDGHHRYTSALQYAKKTNAYGTDSPAGSMFFAIANAFDPALLVFPTHRLAKELPNGELDWKKVEQKFNTQPVDRPFLENFIRSESQNAFVLYWKGNLSLLTPIEECEDSKLPVLASDNLFLKEICGIEPTKRSDLIAYRRGLDEIWDAKDSYKCCVFLPSCSTRDITQISDAGGFLPQKSTYFYPKLAAGLMIRRLK